ncbi:GNAT family acetyltransferase [Rhizocola hellebori]|uniref:GNAT family acetyltransferase n=1 Tax=Rhizocola hellebori TaxID=1392758 RepID=A0A8J3Q7X7_9ACTN|nr:GNAT family N-acetyltransferase [Rhizocola hellebori]GIH05793.1 GNAT family acetyltransferase [Rhizocola hellebori]
MVLLETERLTLREFTPSDVDNLYALDSDPGVMRFINGGRPTPREEIETELLPRILREGGKWAAIERASSDFVGWFALTTVLGARSERELGYRLRTNAWGKGYATEGSRALIRYGFTELGLTRVVANTMTVNAGSRRVMEKCGLSYLRTYHLAWPETIEGTELGDVEYELTRADWENQ